LNRPLFALYTNWKGEAAWRWIEPLRVYYGSTAYHPEQCWLMEAMDKDKGQMRTFKMADFAVFREMDA